MQPLEFQEAEIEGSVAARLERVWSERRDGVVVRGRNGTMRSGELDAWAGGIAAKLREIRANPDRPIALLLPDDAQIVAAMLGVVKSGGFFVPLDVRAPAQYVARILKASGAGVLLTSHEFGPLADSLAPMLERTVLLEGAEPVEGFTSAERGPDAPFSLHFTSGSAGEPKGVLQTNRVLLADLWRQTRDLAVTPADRFGWMLPAVSTASLRDIFGALLAGAELQALEVRGRGMREITRQLRSMGTTVVHLTPTLFRPLAAEWPVGGAPASLRVISLGTEPVLRHDFELFRRHVPPPCVFHHVYGSTETRVISQCFLTHDSDFERDFVPAGWPVWGKEILIFGEGGGAAVPGEIGDICVRSRLLPAGYWNQPEETAARFRGDGLQGGTREFVTGDCGSLHEDGMLELQGRRDLQVKIRGNRIDLLALEARLLSHPWVKEAVATVRSAGAHRDLLAVYLVLDSNRYLGVEQVRSYVGDGLPPFMVPGHVRFLEMLPRLPGGKLDRSALPELKMAAVSDSGLTRPPRPEEAELAAIWAEVLGHSEVPANVSFFDLGGDSILAASLVEAIRERLGKPATLKLFQEGATVESMLGRLTSLGGEMAAGRLVHLNRAGSRPPLYLVPGRRGDSVSFQRLSELLGEDQPMAVIEYRGTHGEERTEDSIEAMARSAISEFRSAGARGPFRLLGASIGGVVAFEMARQLGVEGEDVEFVILLDTVAPMVSEPKVEGRRFRGRHLRRLVRMRFLSARARALMAVGTVRICLAMGREIPGEALRLYRRRQFSRAFERYRTGPADVPLILFRAHGYGAPKAADRNAHRWKSLTTAGVEVRDVRGSHVLIREPHVGLLAAEMRPFLSRGADCSGWEVGGSGGANCK